MISDLGRTICRDWHGFWVCSPRADLFNVAVGGAGACILTAGVLTHDRLGRLLTAALVCLVEALFLVGTAVLYGLELADGRSDDANVASMSLVVCLIFAILLAVLAAAWRKGARWPRTPTIVWNVLLLPAAWTLATTSGLWVGLTLAVVAVAGVVAALLAPSADLPDRAL